jgi:hypothetical protein
MVALKIFVFYFNSYVFLKEKEPKNIGKNKRLWKFYYPALILVLLLVKLKHKKLTISELPLNISTFSKSFSITTRKNALATFFFLLFFNNNKKQSLRLVYKCFFDKVVCYSLNLLCRKIRKNAQVFEYVYIFGVILSCGEFFWIVCFVF